MESSPEQALFDDFHRDGFVLAALHELFSWRRIFSINIAR